MAKDKTKVKASIPQKHVCSRLSYVYQAANYLSVKTSHIETSKTGDATKTQMSSARGDEAVSKQTHYLLSQLKGISRRSTVRLTPEMKHSLCRRCDALLIAGRTSSVFIGNASKQRRKPWADILVIKCKQCGTTKKFPVGRGPQRKSGTLTTPDRPPGTGNPDAGRREPGQHAATSQMIT